MLRLRGLSYGRSRVLCGEVKAVLIELRLWSSAGLELARRWWMDTVRVDLLDS